MFEDAAGLRLTLYLHGRKSDSTGFEIVERNGVTGFRWYEDDMMYVVLAAAGRDRLLAIAEAIGHQLMPPKPT